MSALALLHSLFAYQAWANDELLEKIGSLDSRLHESERHAVMRLLSHCHVVARIFSAHLVGESHGYSADNTEETPALGDLCAAVAASDRWYLDYLEILSPPHLSEPIAFTFTDGDKGRMTRQEMLTHVVLHGGYHRGEVGRILAQLSLMPPWDTFAVHLHQAEPSRRLQVESPAQSPL
ncbi:DNA damage-inducible protein DinB [Mesorhizobium tianshanense]|uniref:Putative damage-inducible protein DinB n=1 Tax=Mesorhizobium tianshanense TaxID=39844 RepID=A0A562NHF1_9HYPH|nr:DinB family protein [Mesorhizobium tianshanense]TWI31622.1 putative damage-inducible protein DinB [Mesorhizobium tianshanense]GLS37128.1 DNA damage-inducible protein DinB [Mesorhizobium tianshanense]